MAGATDLRAEDGVDPRPLWREMNVAGGSGDCVLFEPHLRDAEAVDDVLRAECKVDLTARGEDEFTGDDVV